MYIMYKVTSFGGDLSLCCLLHQRVKNQVFQYTRWEFIKERKNNETMIKQKIIKKEIRKSVENNRRVCFFFYFLGLISSYFSTSFYFILYNPRPDM